MEVHRVPQDIQMPVRQVAQVVEAQVLSDQILLPLQSMQVMAAQVYHQHCRVHQ
jgi:hypothetical protein